MAEEKSNYALQMDGGLWRKYVLYHSLCLKDKAHAPKKRDEVSVPLNLEKGKKQMEKRHKLKVHEISKVTHHDSHYSLDLKV